MDIGFTVDASQFFAFCGRAAASMDAGMGDQNIKGGFENAQAAYLGAMRKRFSSASHGDGTWPDISPSTKLKRYYKAGGRFKRTKGITRMDRLRQIASVPFPILYDTGLLYTSLYPGSPGNILAESPDSISAGSDVPYAVYHQLGGGRLPQRSILVTPTQEILDQMTAPITAGFRAMIAKAISG